MDSFFISFAKEKCTSRTHYKSSRHLMIATCTTSSNHTTQLSNLDLPQERQSVKGLFTSPLHLFNLISCLTRPSQVSNRRQCTQDDKSYQPSTRSRQQQQIKLTTSRPKQASRPLLYPLSTSTLHFAQATLLLLRLDSVLHIIEKDLLCDI